MRREHSWVKYVGVQATNTNLFLLNELEFPSDFFLGKKRENDSYIPDILSGRKIIIITLIA